MDHTVGKGRYGRSKEGQTHSAKPNALNSGSMAINEPETHETAIRNTALECLKNLIYVIFSKYTAIDKTRSPTIHSLRSDKLFDEKCPTCLIQGCAFNV